MTNSQPGLWTQGFIFHVLANLLFSVAFYFLIPTLPLFYSHTLAADNLTIGFLLAVYTMAALIVRPITGLMVDSYGRKFIFLTAFLVFSLFFLLYPLCSSFAAMVALRALHGVSWGVLTSSSTTVAVDLLPPARRGEGLGYFGMAMTLAMGVGPLIGISIIGDNHHYEAMFALGAILSIIGFIFALRIRFVPFIARPKTKFAFAHLFELSSIPVTLTLLILMIPYGGLLSFVSKYGISIGISQPGSFFIVYAAGVALARFFSGKIFDKEGPFRISTLGIILLSGGFIVLAIYPSFVFYLLSALIMGLGVGIIMPVFQAMVNHIVATEKRGVANATLFTGLDLGIGTGMIFTGWCIENYSYMVAFITSSIISALAYICFLYAIRYYKKRMLPK